jgi:hypothetical protein
VVSAGRNSIFWRSHRNSIFKQSHRDSIFRPDDFSSCCRSKSSNVDTFTEDLKPPILTFSVPNFNAKSTSIWTRDGINRLVSISPVYVELDFPIRWSSIQYRRRSKVHLPRLKKLDDTMRKTDSIEEVFLSEYFQCNLRLFVKLTLRVTDEWLWSNTNRNGGHSSHHKPL